MVPLPGEKKILSVCLLPDVTSIRLESTMGTRSPGSEPLCGLFSYSCHGNITLKIVVRRSSPTRPQRCVLILPLVFLANLLTPFRWIDLNTVQVLCLPEARVSRSQVTSERFGVTTSPKRWKSASAIKSRYWHVKQK